MLAELVLSLLTANILMKTASTQYYSNLYGNQYYANMPQQYYQQQQPDQEDMDYEDPIEHEHTRRFDRYKKYGSSGGKLPTIEYDDDRSDECKCSCNRCKDTYRPPKPCCKEVCNSCLEQQDHQDQQGQGGGVVFVPYPYPLMVPGLISNHTTTAKTTTSTTTTTTTTTAKAITKRSEKPIPVDEAVTDAIPKRYRRGSAETINDLILRSNNLRSDKKYILTTMRKTKPTWEPKYNIVPIPDNLAEKLMSQMRQVRELQNRRF